MDANTLTQLISNVGFPIAACCIMFYQNGQLQKTLQELSNTLQIMNERVNDMENIIKK